ncbi:Inositol-tetrakisphosphate 1-kinase [Zootermopsis nevadensis]|uniref:Inositol-tetrakisphosphate 1-kinase n=1 Tax=Zootermopsis nevadensis TaxID=136037 RepID=A0A067QWY4_ZOONE|nr:Inositol-tetrakisphosphate 1-kinase [Zootermopsis nevadensis]
MTEKKSSKLIGYWMSEKKSQKLNWTEFGNICRKYGFDLVKLDLSRPLEEQGPFTIIVHKLTDIIVLAIKGDAKACAMMCNVESYIKDHPEVSIIDPLDNVHKLLDRYQAYSIIHNSDLEEAGVFTPSFVELTSSDYKENCETLRLAGVDFPFVCKPSVSHGSSSAHEMAVIFNENGVKDCHLPCVAQSFINHNALLYKIYMVGDEYFVVERPSLKNFYPSDREAIFFHSHDVSKADSTSSLSILDPSDMTLSTPRPDPAKVQRIVYTLRKVLGMSLLGIDIIIENGSGRYGIIDINEYPGYDGYPDFFDSLMKCILETINHHSYTARKTDLSSTEFCLPLMKPTIKSKISDIMSPGNGDQDDSGFDTGDSSDEKKKRDLSVGSLTASKRSSTAASECRNSHETSKFT